MLTCILAFPVTASAEAEYQVKFNVGDLDTTDSLKLEGDSVPVYVRSSSGTVYCFPVPLGENGYEGYFPLPKGNYEIIENPDAKAGEPVYLGDSFVTGKDNEVNCHIASAEAKSAPSANDYAVDNDTKASEPVSGAAVVNDKPKGEVSLQGKIFTVISIIIVIAMIIFYLYKHFFANRED